MQGTEYMRNTSQLLPHHIFLFQVFVLPLTQLREQPTQAKKLSDTAKKPHKFYQQCVSAIQHIRKTEVILPLIRILHIRF